MSFFLTIIAFIVTIGFLVLIHEGGHFAAARLFGVWVHQFAVGMGPSIWRRKGRETEYSIKIFPIGGYVRMAGEDRESPEDQVVPKERLFTSKPAWQRMIIVFAGPVMNIIAAILLMIMIVGAFGLPYLEVAELVPMADGSPSPSQGIVQVGDRIERVNGRTIYSAQQLQQIIRNADRQAITLELLRNNEHRTVTVRPAWSERDGRYIIGVKFALVSTSNGIAKLEPNSFLAQQGLQAGDRILSINSVPIWSFWQMRELLLRALTPSPSPVGDYGRGVPSGGVRAVLVVQRGEQQLTLTMEVAGRTELELFSGFEPEVLMRRVSVGQTIIVGAQRSWDTVVAIFEWLRSLPSRLGQAGEEIRGPFGIFEVIGQSLQFGLMSLLLVIAVLSLNLGLFNLLPIPALDGSRIL
ncbi:MAG: RIP metalloprotease RseP, partial [Candidatus Bipolaricaulia bacterium]